MGPLGFTEILFIFVLALLLFGPRKLPELGRMLGRGLMEFRRASSDLKATIEEEVRSLEREAQKSLEIAPPSTTPRSPSASTAAPSPPKDSPPS